MASDRELLSEILWRLQRIEMHLGIRDPQEFEAFSGVSEQPPATEHRSVSNPERWEPRSTIDDLRPRLKSRQSLDSGEAEADPPEESHRSDD
jgi:hypothetical protein